MLLTTLDRFFNLLNSLMSHTNNLPSLFPRHCLLCHHSTTSCFNICPHCEEYLPILSHSCKQCAQTLGESHDDTPMICGKCLTNPPPVDQTYALFSYQPPITQFIIRLKFQHQLSYADILGRYIVQQIERVWYPNKRLPDLILPVPLHYKRLQERGFNQALEIARPIAKQFNLPIDIHGIIRHRYTEAQSKLHSAMRKKNIAGAFSAQHDYTGLSIAIIDDVMTTTHTTFELARLLKQQGAKQVVIWCCART